MKSSSIASSFRAMVSTRTAAALVVGAALVLSAACDSPTGSDAAVATITITPTTVALGLNGTQQFVAVARDADDRVVSFSPTWSVEASGGSITSGGLYTASNIAGVFTNAVRATSGTVSATVNVTVNAGALASITLSPTPATMIVLATQQYTAVGRDGSGNVVAVTPTWSVTAGGGTVNGTGLFTAGAAPGVFLNTVRAASGAIVGTGTAIVNVGPLATILVTPAAVTLAIGATQQYTAVGRDVGNNPVTITPVWSVVSAGGTIAAGGLFTAGSTAGTFNNTVRAVSGGISGFATVTVGAGALATITLTPNTAVVSPSGTQQFTATGRDASNNVVSVTPAWSVVASGGTINGTGLFTAGVTPGSYLNTVQATSGTVTALATVHVTSGSVRLPVDLGSAINYVILAKSAISNVPTSAITGDLGISPAAATFITGFALTLPAGSSFSTSAQVTGQIFAPGYAAPAAANLTTAIGDMETAFTDAAGRVTPDFTELASGNIGGLTLPPGLYKWSNTVTIPSSVTLDGSATDVWIFQISGGITQASATQVILTGGALPKNVFWQAFGVVDIGTTAHMEGIILSQTSITLATGATANGRLFAQTAVSLAGVTVVKPAP